MTKSIIRRGKPMATPAEFCRKLGGAGWAALLIAGLSSPAMAQNMVVRSSGPSAQSFPVGSKLKEGARISLAAGDRVTVLTKSGTQALNGPGAFTIGASSTRPGTISDRIAGFVSRNGSRVRTGAVRGDAATAEAAPQSVPNLWFLDPNRGGNFCVANPNMLMAWRSDMSDDASASIVEVASGRSTDLAWRSGSRLKSWPVGPAPLTDGKTYRVAAADGSHPVDVTFAVLTDPPTGIDALIEALIAKGCQNQVELIVDQLTGGVADQSSD